MIFEPHRRSLNELLSIAKYRLDNNLPLEQELIRWIEYRTKERMDAEVDGRLPYGTINADYEHFGDVEGYLSSRKVRPLLDTKASYIMDESNPVTVRWTEVYIHDSDYKIELERGMFIDIQIGAEKSTGQVVGITKIGNEWKISVAPSFPRISIKRIKQPAFYK